MTNELETIKNVEFIPNFRKYCGTCLRYWEKSRTPSVRIASDPVEIRTAHLPNNTKKHYCLIRPARCMLLLYSTGLFSWTPVGARIFTSPRRPDRLWGPPSLLFNGYGGVLSQGVKRPGREANHSPRNQWRGQENVGLYIHSAIRLHDVVLY
jgi:hypothetical protein